MPLLSIPAGQVYSLFVGDFAASGPLTSISNKRTDGVIIKDELATVYLPVLNTDIQNDFHRVNFTLNFYNPNDTVVRLAKGIMLTEAASGPIDTNKYSVLLLSAQSADATLSFYFPEIRTRRLTEIINKKTNVMSMGIEFIAEARNNNTNLIYKNTSSELQSIMGSKWPL